MVLGIGTDLAEVGRIGKSVERFGERFLARVYTQNERTYAMRKANWPERLAARFAAKEAGMKAIGTGFPARRSKWRMRWASNAFLSRLLTRKRWPWPW